MADPAANNWPAPPAEPPVGPTLTNSIPVIKTGRWQQGITYTPECPEGQTLSLYVRGVEKVPTDRPDAVTWIPYILKFYEQCSSYSGVEDAMPRARRGLLSVSEQLLGAELWDGTVSQSENWQGAATPNTWLSDAPLTLDGTIVPAAQGLACLDAYLQTHNAGQQGVIHAPGAAFDAWVVDHLIRFDANGRAFSPLGHLVVSSPGYPGTAPDGSGYAAGLWAYATDMIRIFMDDPRVHDQLVQIIDRENNTTAVLAERRALAEWPRCRHAAVGMDIDVCDLV